MNKTGTGMNRAGAKHRWNWPLFIALLSFIYAILYGIIYLHLSQSADMVAKVWSIVIIAAMVAGALCLVLRMALAGKILAVGSGLVLARAIYNILFLVFSPQAPAIASVIIGVLVVLIPTLVWPVLLLMWFFNKKEVFRAGGDQ